MNIIKNTLPLFYTHPLREIVQALQAWFEVTENEERGQVGSSVNKSGTIYFKSEEISNWDWSLVLG